MKVVASMVLHYGLDFLPWTLRSIYDHVDKIKVVYTPHPSHGTRAEVPCPETENALRDAALSVGPKVRWDRVTAYWQEGQHRDYAISLCRDADLVLVVDADEPWDGAVLDANLKHAWDNSAQTWRLNFSTPWRSFRWMCRDGMWPDRIHDNRPGGADRWGYLPKEQGEHYHFGYAIRDKTLAYKMAIHGHISEWRPGWYLDKWSPWPPVRDVHPTCVDTWNPEPFDRELLPALLREHPFWDEDMIC
jgi:hypothetical protein